VIDLASGMVYPGVRAIKQRLKDAESTCGANSNALARDCEVAAQRNGPSSGDKLRPSLVWGYQVPGLETAQSINAARPAPVPDAVVSFQDARVASQSQFSLS
jgi:hypothetical protein